MPAQLLINESDCEQGGKDGIEVCASNILTISYFF